MLRVDRGRLSGSTRAADYRIWWKGIVAKSSAVPKKPCKVIGKTRLECDHLTREDGGGHFAGVCMCANLCGFRFYYSLPWYRQRTAFFRRLFHYFKPQKNVLKYFNFTRLSISRLISISNVQMNKVQFTITWFLFSFSFLLFST